MTSILQKAVLVNSKAKNTLDMIKNSQKRIHSWLNVNRLQLPLHNLDLDSNTIIRNSAEKSTEKISLSPIAPETSPDGTLKITSDDVTLKAPKVEAEAKTENVLDDDIPIRKEPTLAELKAERKIIESKKIITKAKLFDNKRISSNMSDAERYEILKDKFISDIPSVDNLPQNVIESIKNDEKIGNISSWEDINKYFGSKKRTLIQKIASEFGVFKDYNNSDINIEFTFSKNDYRESYGKQKHNFESFAKMFSAFDKVVENAIGIEVHNRNDEGYKPDVTLKNSYVLISAFSDGDLIYPVKLEVKEFSDKKNSLYVAISLEAIKKTEVSKQGTTENGVAQNSRSVDISIADLMQKVNPKNTNFTKYFPEAFLTNEQKIALEAEEKSKKEKSKKPSRREELHNNVEAEAKTENVLDDDIPIRKEPTLAELKAERAVIDGGVEAVYVKNMQTERLLHMVKMLNFLPLISLRHWVRILVG